MGVDKSGLTFVVVLFVVVIVIGGVVLLADALDSGAAKMTDAQTRLHYARADEERARAERDEVQADIFERRVILYSLTMAAWLGGLDLFDIVLLFLVLALVAVGGYAFGLRRDGPPC